MKQRRLIQHPAAALCGLLGFVVAFGLLSGWFGGGGDDSSGGSSPASQEPTAESTYASLAADMKSTESSIDVYAKAVERSPDDPLATDNLRLLAPTWRGDVQQLATIQPPAASAEGFQALKEAALTLNVDLEDFVTAARAHDMGREGQTAKAMLRETATLRSAAAQTGEGSQ